MTRRTILLLALVPLTGAIAMSLFGRLFGKRNATEGANTHESLPWQHHPSIYEHVKAHIRRGQNHLADGGDALPDEDRLAARVEIRWVPGGMDGVFGLHVGSGDAGQQASEAASFIAAYCKAPSIENKLRLYKWLVERSVIDFVDPLLKSLRGQSGLDIKRLHDLALSLATESVDREPVKAGIAILGMFSGQSDKEVFQTLGRHEEFTLYCAVALANTSERPEEDLWELAKGVNGWGRIHVVERLAETGNPGVKEWLIREGYSNSIMNEYLAYTCAKAGDLRAALDADHIDDGLLLAAGEIIDALLAGGPAEDMDDYEDGAAVVGAYLKHLAPRASRTPELLTVINVRSWLSDEDSDWTAREAKGWTPENRADFIRTCEEIANRPVWRQIVLKELQSDDEKTFYNAARAADLLVIDTWDVHWQRLQDAPLTFGRWYAVMQKCNEHRISDVVALAEKALPLEQIASGPGNEMGLGREYEANRCLDFILQDLGRFPKQGVPLVKAGLHSPVISNRNMALRALSGWGKSRWQQGIEQMLREALAREPEAQVRDWMQKVLDGKELN